MRVLNVSMNTQNKKIWIMKKDSYFEFSSILFTTSKKNTILTIISTVEYICVYFLKFFLGSF